jgi:hypothetical protein
MQFHNQVSDLLIVFSGLDEGVLIVQVAQLRAAQELEKAAEIMLKSQFQQWCLKSNGTNLTPERITKLLKVMESK